MAWKSGRKRLGKPLGADVAGRKRVLGRFYLIQFGIPVVLLLLQVIMVLATGKGTAPRISRPLSAAVGAGLLAMGLALWFFFSSLLYRRLWRLFSVAGEEGKFWTYAEGVFGLVGVGVAMPALLGFFHFLLTADLAVGVALAMVSLALGAGEAYRFDGKVVEAIALAGEAGVDNSPGERGEEG
jgi:hypothetical protein